MGKGLNYNLKDILWGPAKGFSTKKITIMTIYLVVSLLVFDLFVYLAFAVRGDSVSKVFNVLGIFAIYQFNYNDPIFLFIIGLGIFFSGLICMLGMTTVAKIDLEFIRGHRFYPLREVLKYPFVKFKQLFLALLGIIVFILFVVLLYLLFGLIGRIPFIGEWLYSIFFLLPSFIIAILTVFIIFVLVASFFIMPAVTAYDDKNEAFQSILETFTTIIRRPIQWLWYTFYGLIVGKLFSFVYAYFAYRAVEFSVMASAITGGDKIKTLVKQALTILPHRSDLVEFMTNIMPGINFGFDLSRHTIRGEVSAAAYLLSFMLLLIFASVVAYYLSAIATTQMRAYLLIRYLKDNKKIDEE